MSNVWVSSPSPSLHAFSPESPSPSALLVGWRVASTLPRRLWDAYVAYLWYYQPNSWVGRVASTFRILALILVFPVVLLTLLDVTSYVIARTLGVVDDVKASTSDTDTAADGDDRRTTTTDVGVGVGVGDVAAGVPVSKSEGPARASEGLAPEDSVEAREVACGDGRGRGRDGERGGGGCEDGDGRVSGAAACAESTAVHAGAETRTRTQTQTYYFAGEEDLRLAGDGVFSPAGSVPPSPLTPRMQLPTFPEIDGRGSARVGEDGVVLRRRAQGAREDNLVRD